MIDSASLVTPADAGRVIVTASHGGLLGGRPETAIKVPVFAAVYNDAGWGIDGAGVSRLPALDARGIAGACVSAFSARIGDGLSTYHDGFVSAVNATAVRHGGRIGQSAIDFCDAMLAAAQRAPSVSLFAPQNSSLSTRRARVCDTVSIPPSRKASR